MNNFAETIKENKLPLAIICGTACVVLLLGWIPRLYFEARNTGVEEQLTLCVEAKENLVSQFQYAISGADDTTTLNECRVDADCALTTEFSCTLATVPELWGGENELAYNRDYNFSALHHFVEQYEQACAIPKCDVPAPLPYSEAWCIESQCVVEYGSPEKFLPEAVKTEMPTDSPVELYFSPSQISSDSLAGNLKLSNLSENTVWLQTRCSFPFMFRRNNGSGFITAIDPFPTKGCIQSHIALDAGESTMFPQTYFPAPLNPLPEGWYSASVTYTTKDPLAAEFVEWREMPARNTLTVTGPVYVTTNFDNPAGAGALTGNIEATIHNDSDRTIYVFTICNTPFGRLWQNKIGAVWQYFDAHALKDCFGPQVVLAPGETSTWQDNLFSLYKIFGESFVYDLNSSHVLQTGYSSEGELGSSGHVIFSTPFLGNVHRQ